MQIENIMGINLDNDRKFCPVTYFKINFKLKNK